MVIKLIALAPGLRFPVEQFKNRAIEPPGVPVIQAPLLFHRGQGFGAAVRELGCSAQIHVKHTGRLKLLHSKMTRGLRPPADHIQIPQQLELQAMFHQNRIKHLAAGFIIDDHAPRLPLRSGTNIHAINPPP
ncbi:hypothetical protein SDC9_191388 [bioreactor metagenome]|uniref:Uncharacterized protein n=1 Tax=bioreactor metagenome TaxID=1076179 RepID=A0A645HXV2_9ZZZZ